VSVFDDTNETTLTTGPARMRINRQGMRGISQTWLDINLDGRRSFQKVLTDAGVDRKLWQQLSVFNSVNLEAVPESGQLVKLVR
jgi:hypothetical protein